MVEKKFTRGKRNATKQTKYTKNYKVKTKKSAGLKESTALTSCTFPPIMKNVFMYADNGYGTPSSGLSSAQYYRLNNLWDPDYTGTGTKVQYYDQLFNVNMYQKYLVTGAKVDLVLKNMGSAPTSIQLTYGELGELNIASNPSDVDIIDSLPNSWTCTLNSVDSVSSTKKYSFYVDMAKSVRLPYAKYKDLEWTPSINSATPPNGKQVVLVINRLGGVAGSPTGSSNMIVHQIKIKYYVRCMNLTGYQYQRT